MSLLESPPRPDIYAPDADGIVYPCSDGKPLGETEWHVIEILYLLAILRQYFKDVEDVYCAGDLFLCYQRSMPKSVVTPDVMVIRGVDKHARPSFKVWEEGHAPCCVIEVTSNSSRREDLRTKRAVYARLGVPEYFDFDPLRDYLNPPLVFFRLTASGEYERQDGEEFVSEQLGLRLRAEGNRLRLYDLATGRRLLDPDELGQVAQEREQAIEERERAIEQQAQAISEAEAARQAAEAVRRAEAQARAEAEHALRAEADARAHAEAAQKAEAEARSAAAAEVARLRAELERLTRQSQNG